MQAPPVDVCWNFLQVDVMSAPPIAKYGPVPPTGRKRHILFRWMWASPVGGQGHLLYVDLSTSYS